MKVSKKRIKVCVVIPAYNEADIIGSVIKNATKAFKGSAFDTSILVINDGSTDTTSQTARNNGAIVVDHILNSGAGSATATGLSYAQQNGFDIAATMDGDGQHLAKDVLNGVETILNNGADLLIGSRLINSIGMSGVKVLGNKGLTLITYILFGINVTDSQSGLRIFSQDALRQLKWKTAGYEFCSEMLWRAKQLDLKVEEYAISAIYTKYSTNKGQNNWNAINIVKSLVKRRIIESFE